MGDPVCEICRKRPADTVVVNEQEKDVAVCSECAKPESEAMLKQYADQYLDGRTNFKMGFAPILALFGIWTTLIEIKQLLKSSHSPTLEEVSDHER